jgi:deazaflavin-dependent oxidoreductase (nitroreductase family)
MPLPKSIAILNKHITNRFFLLFAGWIPPLAMVKHRGRTSGRYYRTPIMAFPTDNGYVFALTYGKGVDWVKNLLASNSGGLKYNGADNLIHSIHFASYEDVKDVFPVFVRQFLRILSVNDCLITEKKGLKLR